MRLSLIIHYREVQRLPSYFGYYHKIIIFQLISIYDLLIQVDEFLKEEVEPVLKQYEGSLQGTATLDI